MDLIIVLGRYLPVSHILEILLYTDQQFADDCIAIFGNSSCNRHHRQSFEHVAD